MPGEAQQRPAAEGEAALAALDRAIAARPARDGPAFAAATAHLCRMRDRLVAQGREAGARPPELGLVNAIISTALGGHFPIGTTPWPEIEHARDALARLLGGEAGR